MSYNSYGKTGLTSLFGGLCECRSDLASLASIEDNGGYYEVDFDLKDYNLGNICVEIENRELVVKARKDGEHYEQRLLLPRDASYDANATFRNGRLEVTIPKHPNKSYKKIIPIT